MANDAIRITANEAGMLRNIVENEYNGQDVRGSDPVWSDCLDCGPVSIPSRSHGGIVSSLCQKGLARSNGEDVHLTPAGFAIWADRFRPMAIDLMASLGYNVDDLAEFRGAAAQGGAE